MGMLLAQFIPFIDAEIDRLQRARDLLAYVPPSDSDFITRDTQPDVTAKAADAAPEQQQSVLMEATPAAQVIGPETKIIVVRPYRATRRVRSVRKRHTTLVESALRGPVPAGPVAISAEQVRNAQASKAPQAGKLAEFTVETQDWRHSATDRSSVDAMLRRLLAMGTGEGDAALPRGEPSLSGSLPGSLPVSHDRDLRRSMPQRPR